jgi:hypothetical protein
MDRKQILGVVVGGIVLFLWSGLSQSLFPWGIQAITQPANEADIGAAIASVTEDGMVYIGSPVTAYVAVKPAAYNAPARYFTIEFITQLLVAAVLMAILVLARGLSMRERVGLVGLVALAGIFTVDLQYWNWWGFSTLYSVGFAVNRLVGYLIAGSIQARFFV